MHYHGSTSNLMIHLQPINLSEEKIDLIRAIAPGVPTRFLHRGAGSSKRKRRRQIPNIKPHLLPVDDLVTQLIGDILRFLPLAKLQPSASNYVSLRIIGMRLQMKEILEQIEVGLNPQESFTEMDKDRDVKNRIRGQVMHLNPPKMK